MVDQLALGAHMILENIRDPGGSASAAWRSVWGRWCQFAAGDCGRSVVGRPTASVDRPVTNSKQREAVPTRMRLHAARVAAHLPRLSGGTQSEAVAFQNLWYG